MDTVRGLTLWLAPALFSSLGGTAVLQIIGNGPLSGSGLRFTLGFGLTTAMFTVPGSALLCLTYAWSEHRGLVPLARYGVLLVLAPVAGAVMLALPFGPPSMAVGAAYALTTACLWIALHRLLYRGR
jgi:hypothetical protein